MEPDVNFLIVATRCSLSPGLMRSGTVAGKKIDIEFQAGTLFEHRNAIFFRRAGIHGRFVDDDIALLQGLADRLATL